MESTQKKLYEIEDYVEKSYQRDPDEPEDENKEEDNDNNGKFIAVIIKSRFKLSIRG